MNSMTASCTAYHARSDRCEEHRTGCYAEQLGGNAASAFPVIASAAVAVGTAIARRPPHRGLPGVRLSRTRLLSRVIQPRRSGFESPMQLRSRTGPVQVTRCPGSVPGACFAVRSSLDQVPSLHPLRRRSLDLVHGLRRSDAPVRLLATVHHRFRLIAFPMRTARISACRSVARPPRFRRVPFLRDVVFDHGRASAPRIAVPHMLPFALGYHGFGPEEDRRIH